MSSAPFSPAADRNKEPILDRLRELLPAGGRALEIASGTGQHAAWFAAALPQWTWQPTDADPQALPGIEAHCSILALPNLLLPRRLDVLAHPWPADGAPFAETAFDAVYCANMLHIAPWACCAGLMLGSARVLRREGLLITYGPYLEDEVPTAAGNLAFDQSLRERDPQWGLRPLAQVVVEAASAGLALRSRHPMPANNLLLEFARS